MVASGSPSSTPETGGLEASGTQWWKHLDGDLFRPGHQAGLVIAGLPGDVHPATSADLPGPGKRDGDLDPALVDVHRTLRSIEGMPWRIGSLYLQTTGETHDLEGNDVFVLLNAGIDVPTLVDRHDKRNRGRLAHGESNLAILGGK